MFVYRGLGTAGPVEGGQHHGPRRRRRLPSRLELTFADLDRDGTDELVIGDADATVDGVSNAGQAAVFGLSPTEPFAYGPPVELYDNQPETRQRLGRALTTARFAGTAEDTDTLMIGASSELFTYFRALVGGADPRE